MLDTLALFQQYKDPVYRLALSYTKSVQDAEDVTQTVFLKLLKQPDITCGKEKAWLMQVTANECRNLLKSFWRRNMQPLDESIAFQTKEASDIFDAVMALKPEYRAVVYLYYYEGYSTEEIGAILKLSQSAVTTRLQRARRKLRSQLEEVRYDAPIQECI